MLHNIKNDLFAAKTSTTSGISAELGLVWMNRVYGFGGALPAPDIKMKKIFHYERNLNVMTNKNFNSDYEGQQVKKESFTAGIGRENEKTQETQLSNLQGACTSNQEPFVVYTEDGAKTLDELHPETLFTGKYSLDDRGVSNMFADGYSKKMRYVIEDKCYYTYDSGRWIEGNEKAAEFAKEFAEAFLERKKSLIGYKTYDSLAKKLQSTRARENLLKDAKTVHPIHKSEFDKDPYLLNCLNGTLDLKTGILHTHNPDDMLSKLADVEYVPGARCLRWEKHIEEVTNGDKELAEYLQKCFGYALTGNSRFECFLCCMDAVREMGKQQPLFRLVNCLGIIHVMYSLTP